MNNKKVLIVGVSGLLGSNVAYAWREQYHVMGVYYQHPVNIQGVHTQALNVLDKSCLNDVIQQFNPDVILNCAALTDIDYCEDHHDEAKILNVDLVRNLVEVVDGKNIKLIHISTDNVFDGVKGTYKEDDQVNPLSVYGHTKYAGELEALKNPHALVARTNIFGWNIQPNKYSLAEWCVKELTAGNRIKGFIDVNFSSIYTFILADLLAAAVTKNLTGVYHTVSATSMKKYDFLMTIAKKFDLNEGLIDSISVDEFSFRAQRPKNLSLSVEKLNSTLEKAVPAMQTSIDDYVNDAPCGLNSRG